MRTVEIDGRSIELTASALGPLTWYRSFGDDGLYPALLSIEPNGGAMPMLAILRLAWTMAHDADVAAKRDSQPFEAWVASLGEVDFMRLRDEVIAEATSGYFPALKTAAEKLRKSRKRTPKGDAAGEREGDGPDAG